MEQLNIIKQTIINLLDSMGFVADVSIDETDTDNIVVNINTEEAGFLIGQAGSTLQALQHLTRILVMRKAVLSGKNNEEILPFVLDINNYRKHRSDLLHEMALNMAKQAVKENNYLFLQPMPAYERRIVHIALANSREVETESTGEGEERRVIIKPKK